MSDENCIINILNKELSFEYLQSVELHSSFVFSHSYKNLFVNYIRIYSYFSSFSEYVHICVDDDNYSFDHRKTRNST